MPERTLPLIAAEINIIKEQTKKIVLSNFVEIGRRLAEAKSQIKYGEWGTWLKEEVGFSQRRAEKLMLLYDAYGSLGPALAEDGAQDGKLPNLNYTHALILLGVPEEDRVQLISDMDLESMTTRELEQVVNELKQTKQEQADLQKNLAEESEKTIQLAEEVNRLKKESDELRRSQQKLQQDLEKKVLEHQKLAQNSNLKSYQRVSNELAAVQIKLLTSKIAFRYEALEKVYNELSYEMNLLAKVDAQVHGEYQKMLNGFLVKAMEARMG
ncbi:type IIA topoisomerase (DNA gyrase/topo II, topoisomerase IV), A subunit [Desulfosporosinus orientis DSM 765]|uniref:Type IIA topoisomerase (DNA gyrase/topo II, topoisomerase IV), A subunit n=1 Tax=Desulfosporosinus orientis (strain ATCC 19365 / DSM 765 / NCIMB 8382 / VKM B-1628 / Singapore I) TaxID=768706 RepID=G7W754_DESOD|nr:DUF3102 domain-containing protein [Desulfosporosinus orientis]AET70562.1 type IIA topoisomerase (DNA gyrase/topo II, topoisomerase IV), A subunit [Desulfosporosinus orientis DSM 765]